MRWWTREHLKSEKGNALLMALSVIMILLAFGTASLMTSVANIHMSANYRNWSQDYYALDINAEAKVNQLNALLLKAEKDAQDYMAGQYYLYSDTDSDPSTLQPPTNLQVPTYAQSYINAKWLADVAPTMEDLNNSDYQASLKDFMNDTFQRLYYYYASERLSPGGYASVTYLKESTFSLLNYQAAVFSSGEQGTQVLLDGNLVVDINSAVAISPTDHLHEISAINPNTVKGKSVAVKVDVRFPTYVVQTQTKQIPLQGNPVWANAITAAGNIGFIGSGTSTINGDIYSADSSESVPINDNIVTDNGIYSQGARAEINGNVYSKGNLHIIGSNSTIDVQEYPSSMDVSMKDKIFSKNSLFFDLEKVPGSLSNGLVTDYIEKDSGIPSLPMVYKDIKGGNVYCNSLAVEGTYPNQADQAVSSGTINVDGNVTTYNDIRMDGLQSQITVGKNYIGVNSTPDSTGDPNASSSVLNNSPLTSTRSTESTITLNGNFIAPGTAFAKYNGVKVRAAKQHANA